MKGETRIAVIALRDISEGEELTFDYQWKALGSRQIKYVALHGIGNLTHVRV